MRRGGVDDCIIHPAHGSQSRKQRGWLERHYDRLPRFLLTHFLSDWSSLRWRQRLLLVLALMGFSADFSRPSLPSVRSTPMSARNWTASFVSMHVHRVRPDASPTRSRRRQLVGSWRCIARDPAASPPGFQTFCATKRITDCRKHRSHIAQIYKEWGWFSWVSLRHNVRVVSATAGCKGGACTAAADSRRCTVCALDGLCTLQKSGGSPYLIPVLCGVHRRASGQAMALCT